ncbi:MAG TPA: hypothetical protein VHO72_15535 [Bacteroidales bacterium]|nr:hypothetical protein [Bacteroidales bacterium]
MVKKKILIILFIGLILVHCKKESNDVDYIEITNVSPISGLVDNQLTNFTIKGQYNLSSHSTGILMIGFNNGNDVKACFMISAQEKIINKGKGFFEFNVSALVKDWKTEGDFIVYINISPNPHESSWKPYISKTYTIISKSN